MATWTTIVFMLMISLPFTLSQFASMQQNKNTFEGDTDAEKAEKVSAKVNKSEVVLVLLMSTQSELPIYFELLKPTIELAVEYVNSKYTEFTLKVKSRKDSNVCESNVIGGMVAEEYYTNQLNGLLGPICSKALEGAARLASYWGIPLITAGGIGIEFSNKKVYQSLTRIAFSLGKICFLVSYKYTQFTQ